MTDNKHHASLYFILHVTADETFENVVITLFYFEQGTDENYYDFFALLHTSTASGFLTLSPERGISEKICRKKKELLTQDRPRTPRSRYRRIPEDTSDS